MLVPLKQQTLVRQLDLIPLACLKIPITVIGAGAVGSHVVTSLAKMGMEDITVFDADTVSPENMNAQGFGLHQVGVAKVDALHKAILEMNGTKITAMKARYLVGAFPGIVISAVDNMETRRLIWENHKEKALSTIAIIDPRMAIEDLALYTMNPMSPIDQKTYEKTLYTDAESVQERCTMKSTIYTASLLSGLVCKAVKDLITGSKYSRTVLWNVKENDMNVWASA